MKNSILFILIVPILALCSFTIPSSHLTNLCVGSEKVWRHTKFLINDYNVPQFTMKPCMASMRYKFFRNDQIVAMDTTCDQNGRFVLPSSFEIRGDSIQLNGITYKIDVLTSTRMILSYSDQLGFVSDDSTRFPSTNGPSVLKLLFEAQ
jgi:hypothetical protein